MQKVRAEIDLGHIRRNGEKFSALTGKKLCAVVKANAYGHGAEETVNALNGIADFFAVALIEEGLAIKTAACGKEILVFTPPTDEEECYALLINGFTASVGDLWTAKLLSKACRKYGLPIKVHLKVNTGMNRYGMHISMLGKVCKFLQSDPFVKVAGIYSHLCECNYQRAEKQRALFVQMQRVCKRYFPCVISHLGATYGALLGEEFTFDMVRVGIGLYGYLPCPPSIKSGVDGETVQGLALEKAMTVYAKTIATRKLSFGSAGYGEEFSPLQIAEIKRISVCRVGYADGFLRKRKNGAFGWESNINNACMDASVRKGGKDRGEWTPVLIDADETAKKTGTISYEVLCAATRRAELCYRG